MTTKPKKRNSIEKGILIRNQLTTYRNVELETIDKAWYWQKRKEQVAYDGLTKYFLLITPAFILQLEKKRKRMRTFAPTATNSGLASVWLLYLVQHLYFLWTFVLNLNSRTSYPTPNAKPRPVSSHFNSENDEKEVFKNTFSDINYFYCVQFLDVSKTWRTFKFW